MAIRGVKPVPTPLKLVKGRPGHHPLPKNEAVTKEPLGGRPEYLEGRAAEIWDKWASRAWWLGDVDCFKLAGFCNLQAEMEENPREMIASRITQWRMLGTELGFDPSARTRIEGLGSYGKHATPSSEDGKDPFFDD